MRIVQSLAPGPGETILTLCIPHGLDGYRRASATVTPNAVTSVFVLVMEGIS
jgi:hypothetical protein